MVRESGYDSVWVETESGDDSVWEKEFLVWGKPALPDLSEPDATKPFVNIARAC